MVDLERSGVQLVAEGVGTFVSQLQRADAAYSALDQRFAEGTKKSSSILGGMGKAAAGVSMPMLALGTALGNVATTIATKFVTSLQSAVTLLPRLAMEAAPLPGIATAFAAAAARTGLSLDALSAAAKGTVSDFKLMQTANVALTGAGVELGKAMGENLPKLMEIARASAKATGQDVDFLFNSLVSGVKRTSPMLIDNTGLVLKLGEANEQMAQKVGVGVKELTGEQKQIALLNATVEAGADIISLYGDSQLTAAEEIARAGSQVQNIKDTIGLALQPALQSAAGAVADLVQGFSNALKEGGALYPILTNLGAVASMAADGFRGFASTVIDAIGLTTNVVEADVGRMGHALAGVPQAASEAGSSFLSNLVGKFQAAAQSALSWGVEIVTSLATGIVQGAAAALTAAMNYIGSILSSWLGPGSPPKIAPEIDLWGAEAMTEYLKGFSEADFGVLDKVQSILKQVLEGPEFAQLSKELIAGISAGEVDIAFFDKLASKAGEFGNEIAELTKLNLELAQAEKEVEATEKALEDARKAISDSQSDVARLTQEYNNMLRAGASPEVLKAKQAEINASLRQMQIAKKQASQAETANKEAKEGLGDLQEEAKLQELLVRELLELRKAQEGVAEGAADQAKAAAKAAKAAAKGKGAAALGMPELPKPTAMGKSISDTMDKAIDSAKGKIQEKLAELFAPLTIAWETQMAPALDRLRESFGGFVTTVARLWNEKLKPALEELKRFVVEEVAPLVTEGWRKIRDAASKAWDEITSALGEAWAAISEAFGDMDVSLEEFGITWEDIAKVVLAVITAFVDGAVIALNVLGETTAFLIRSWAEGFRIAAEIWEGIKTTITTIITVVTDAISNFATWCRDTWERIKVTTVATWEAIRSAVTAKVGELFTAVTTKIDEIASWLETKATDFYNLGAGLVQGIIDGAGSLWDALVQKAKDLARAAIDAIKGIFGVECPEPSPVTADIGAGMVEGFIKGIEEMAKAKVPAIPVAFAPIGAAMLAHQRAAPVMSPAFAAPAQQFIRQAPISIVNNVYSGMDEAQLEVLIRQVVARELGA